MKGGYLQIGGNKFNVGIQYILLRNSKGGYNSHHTLLNKTLVAVHLRRICHHQPASIILLSLSIIVDVAVVGGYGGLPNRVRIVTSSSVNVMLVNVPPQRGKFFTPPLHLPCENCWLSLADKHCKWFKECW